MQNDSSLTRRDLLAAVTSAAGLAALGSTADAAQPKYGAEAEIAEATNEVLAGWSILFVPSNAAGISVIINGQFWNRRREAGDYAVTWHVNEGQVETPLPAPFSQIDDFYVNASAQPYGTHAHMTIKYNGQEKENMEFEKEENHRVKR